MVAAGELDAHFTYGIHVWDIAAGDLIVREAGGVVMDTSGLYQFYFLRTLWHLIF
jgi:myo-inositol-1(or 4)-monophosphatase